MDKPFLESGSAQKWSLSSYFSWCPCYGRRRESVISLADHDPDLLVNDADADELRQQVRSLELQLIQAEQRAVEESEAKMAAERELEKERSMRERTVEVLANERKSQSLPSSTSSSAEVAKLKADLAKKESELAQVTSRASQSEKRLSAQVQQLEREKSELEKRAADAAKRSSTSSAAEADAKKLMEEKRVLEEKVAALEATVEEQKKELSFQYSMGGKEGGPAGVGGATAAGGLNRPARRGRGRPVRPGGRGAGATAEASTPTASEPVTPEAGDATADVEEGGELKFTAEQLKDKDSLPEGVDRAKLDEYLLDEEYEKLFKMSKEEYLAMPKWKRSMKKKAAGLM